MKKVIALIALMLILSACGPSEAQIQQAIAETQTIWTKVPTQTAYPTHTMAPTYTAEPTVYVTKIVTQTFTPTPEFTPTITNTPTATPNPTEIALEKSRILKGPGFYLVNDEISPGVWRSTGESDSCYWAITNKTGKLLSNHFGMAGGTMYIPSSAFQVELDSDCGIWEFISE